MDTLRYCDWIGLLGDIARSSTGRRCFSVGLGVLRCLRDTGMSLAEVWECAPVPGAVATRSPTGSG